MIDDPAEIERRSAMRQALGALTGVVSIGVIVAGDDGHPWYRSQRWIDLSSGAGTAGEDEPWYAALVPEDRPIVEERWRSRVELRGRLGVLRARGRDGVVRMFRAQSVVMVGEHGNADGNLIVLTDAGRTAELPSLGAPAGSSAGSEDGMGSLSTPELLDVVFDRSQDVITILNADGSWRWSNGGTIRLLGHQQNFDAKDGLFSLLHPDDVAHARDVLARTLSGTHAEDGRVEVRVRAADGSWRWMEGFIDVLIDDPAVRGVVVHLRDETQRRRMTETIEEAHGRLVDLVTSMRIGVVLTDEDRRVVVVNRAFLDLFHIAETPESLVGRRLATVGITVSRLVAEPRDAQEQLDAFWESGQQILGGRCVLFDGRTLECDLISVVIQGTPRGRIGMYRDITDQARLEAERERLLESEIEENRRLSELDLYRSEAIASVSHELRTPLTSIVGYTQLLRSTLAARATEEEKTYLDAIARNVDRLLRLAGDVVALDSLESNAMPLPIATVNVPEIVRRSVATVRPQAVERSIDLVVETSPGPSVLGDEDRLGQLFENLLANAVKFTLPAGRISVHAAPVADGDGRTWEVAVSDTGIGIPEDEIGMLSTRFYRASNARRRGLPGTGLGLSVARAIAERHGGSLWVRSVVGVGTTVYVRVADAVEPDHRSGSTDGEKSTDRLRGRCP